MNASVVVESQKIELYISKINDVLKETDNIEAKNRLQDFLKNMTDSFSIVVVGGNKSGRTSLINKVFLNGEQAQPTEGIMELRYGEMDAIVPKGRNYIRKFINNTSLDGLVIYDIGDAFLYQQQEMEEIASKADIILAVISSDDIHNSDTWNFIEKNCDLMHTICVMTKSDLYSQELVFKKVEKLKDYFKDENISAPVFPTKIVSSGDSVVEEGIEDVRHHIKQLLGENVKTTKRFENVIEVKNLFDELIKSIIQRKRQLEIDREIMLSFDVQLNKFRLENDGKIKSLKTSICSYIDDEILEYQNKILSWLDPNKINKNFDTKMKENFDYQLKIYIGDSEKRLNNNIANLTRKTIDNYIRDLEVIYSDAEDRLNNRELVLAENDIFYGSIAYAQKLAAKLSISASEETRESYRQMSTATEELYGKIMRARQRKSNNQNAGMAIGEIASVGIAVKVGMLAAGVSVGMAAVIGLVVLVAFTAATMTLAHAIFSNSMNSKVNVYIDEFKQEVVRIKEQMKEDVIERIASVFENELDCIDLSFKNFRMCTNIAEQNIPMLEEQIIGGELIFEELRRMKEGIFYE